MSLDAANYYTNNDLINSNAYTTSDSASDNKSIDNDNVNPMNIDMIMKYPDVS